MMASDRVHTVRWQFLDASGDLMEVFSRDNIKSLRDSILNHAVREEMEE